MESIIRQTNTHGNPLEHPHLGFYQCPDYDLCEVCEEKQSPESNLSEHQPPCFQEQMEISNYEQNVHFYLLLGQRDHLLL